MADALSAFGTFYNQDAGIPYNDSTLADPNTLAYDYVAPSLANHPNGFVGPSYNIFPYLSSSSEAGIQGSPYSPSEAWSGTASSQGTDGSNNNFQGLP